MQIEKLTKETILEDTTFEEIIDEKDEIYRQRLINDLTDRAAELGVKTKFTSLSYDNHIYAMYSNDGGTSMVLIYSPIEERFVGFSLKY